MEENKNEEVKEDVVQEQPNCMEDTELNAVKTELEETIKIATNNTTLIKSGILKFKSKEYKATVK